jgi:menaquinol-cytochrome c reductase iron-sulfur subunit
LTHSEPAPSADTGRRRFLSGVIATLHAGIGATLAFLLGGAAIAPAFGTRRTNWWPAGDISDLADNEPTPTVIRVTRDDGYRQSAQRQVVFLVKTGDSEVRALSSTCTHLGCRVSWDPSDQVLKCPCHGGVFDRMGAVKAGPPRAPLASIQTRLENDQVLVEL